MLDIYIRYRYIYVYNMHMLDVYVRYIYTYPYICMYISTIKKLKKL